jgi:hypothetical protein
MFHVDHGFCGPQITLERLAELHVTIASGNLLSAGLLQNSSGHMGTGKIPGQIWESSLLIFLTYFYGKRYGI